MALDPPAPSGVRAGGSHLGYCADRNDLQQAQNNTYNVLTEALHWRILRDHFHTGVGRAESPQPVGRRGLFFRPSFPKRFAAGSTTRRHRPGDPRTAVCPLQAAVTLVSHKLYRPATAGPAADHFFGRRLCR